MKKSAKQCEILMGGSTKLHKSSVQELANPSPSKAFPSATKLSNNRLQFEESHSYACRLPTKSWKNMDSLQISHILWESTNLASKNWLSYDHFQKPLLVCFMRYPVSVSSLACKQSYFLQSTTSTMTHGWIKVAATWYNTLGQE